MRAGRRLGSAFGEEAVADPWFSLDVFPGRVALEFFAELADEDAEVFRLLGGLCAPDRGEKNAVSEDLAGVAREEQEQVEFFGGEVHGAAGDADGVRGGIDDKIADLDGAVAGALGSAAEMSTDAGKEFLDVEGLGDVVVGSGIEGFDLGVFLIADGEDDDRGTILAANGAAEIDAGHAGHHEVGDDEVRIPFLEEAHGFFGIVHGAHVVALCGKRGAEYASDLKFVVHYKNAFRHDSGPEVLSAFMKKDTPRLIKILLRYAVLTVAALLLVGFFRKVVSANQTTVALSFVMLILVTASQWRLAYSVYLSVLSALLYDFFFLPPLHHLTIADPRNWVAMGAFLCCAVTVSHLAEREHLQAETAEKRREEVERLYEFSQQLLLQEDLRGVGRTTPSVVAAVFGFRAVALYVREEDAAYYSDPKSELLPLAELKLAANQSEAGVNKRDGYYLIPLALGMQSLGVLAVTDGGFSPQIYEAIGSLVAIALERAETVERSSRLEASRESERLRTALLDSVTHDLRTPLTAIRAAATTMVSQPNLSEAERAELAAVLDEESARLDRLIGQAVEMAQLDAEAVQIHPRPQDVRELIETTLEEMRPVLRERAVEVEVAGDLKRAPMDRALVHRVLRHLIENAVRYSPQGSPIEVSAAKDEYRLLVTVADRGPGIEPGDQPFVFDKFFRGRKQRSQGGGTGMGLAIVKAILEAHGGGIELKSRAGEGTRFTFWLPLENRVQGTGYREQGTADAEQEAEPGTRV